MRLIKKLDLYVLKNFLMLFAGTFCISLFVVMMQFLWKYIDELVGKGLGLDVTAKFFFYAAVTLVPLALPLAILLAALISFGNLGERLELLSIKAAGISLIRTLRPLIIVVLLLSGASFYFQNVLVPQAQMNLLQLRLSIQVKSPEVEIPEGVFYDGIDRINLYVKHKNKDTGMLYDVMIYNMQDGIDRAHIILADSALLETSADKKHLLLYLYEGEQFENLNSAALMAKNVPYRRETFLEKHFLINFDTNFSMADADNVSSMAATKNMKELIHDIDSMQMESDSVGRSNYDMMKRGTLYVPREKEFEKDDNVVAEVVEPVEVTGDAKVVEVDKEVKPTEVTKVPKVTRSVKAKKVAKGTKVEEAKLVASGKGSMHSLPDSMNVDSMFARKDFAQKEVALGNALMRIRSQQSNTVGYADTMQYYDSQIRRHWIEFWQKITMSLACLVFFFIGAPLGAILRKGGLGLPVVVSVIIFIVYYIINTGGMKMGREGSIPVWFGMWASTIVLAPLGAFFTVKSNNDSVVFNLDSYKAFFVKLLGIKQTRHIVRKEVIIDDPCYETLVPRLQNLAENARAYRKEHRHLWQLQLLIVTLKNKKNPELLKLNAELEAVVDELSNSRDRQLLLLLNAFPILRTAPRLSNRLRKELRTVYKTCEQVILRINEILGVREETVGGDDEQMTGATCVETDGQNVESAVDDVDDIDGGIDGAVETLDDDDNNYEEISDFTI